MKNEKKIKKKFFLIFFIQDIALDIQKCILEVFFKNLSNEKGKLGFSFYMLWRSSGPIYSKIQGGMTGPKLHNGNHQLKQVIPTIEFAIFFRYQSSVVAQNNLVPSKLNCFSFFYTTPLLLFPSHPYPILFYLYILSFVLFVY